MQGDVGWRVLGSRGFGTLEVGGEVYGTARGTGTAIHSRTVHVYRQHVQTVYIAL